MTKNGVFIIQGGLTMIKIEEVIWKVLVAIYTNNLMTEKLFLKGGQALRFAEGIENRLSRDADFSLEETVSDEDNFFEVLENAISNEFMADDLYVFDFTKTRRPHIKESGSPDFKRGWAVTFKIIEKEKIHFPLEKLRRESIIPEGSESPKIPIDISEKEYCGSIQKVKVKSIEIKVYSRALLALEKIRAICQSHPSYPHKNKKKSKARSRDLFDIERLYSKSLGEDKSDEFVAEMKVHLEKVFKAKDVSLDLLYIAINDEIFIEALREGWKEVKTTLVGKQQSFDYYMDTLISLVKRIKLD